MSPNFVYTCDEVSMANNWTNLRLLPARDSGAPCGLPRAIHYSDDLTGLAVADSNDCVPFVRPSGAGAAAAGFDGPQAALYGGCPYFGGSDLRRWLIG